MDEITRFEWFCKLRSQIRGSDNHLIVGIDIAKDKHHAFFGTPKGQSLWRRLIFTNDLTGFNRLIEQANTLMTQHDLTSAVFGMEPTSNYHKPLIHWMTEQGYLVVLVAGKAVKDNREVVRARRAPRRMSSRCHRAPLTCAGNRGPLLSQSHNR